MAQDIPTLEEVLDSSLSDDEKRTFIRKFYPEMDARSPAAASPQNAVERFAAPFITAGKGLASALGGVGQVPGAIKDILAQDTGDGKNAFRNMAAPSMLAGRTLKEALSGIFEGTKAGAMAEAESDAPNRSLRTALASVPLVGQPAANIVRNVGEGDYAGALGEGVLNLLPLGAGKLAKVRGAGTGAAEEVAALNRAKASPTGQMLEALGGADARPVVAAQKGARIANEELAQLGASPIDEGVSRPSQVASSVKEQLARRNDDLRVIDERTTAQTAGETARLKDELMQQFPERFTPTEAGTFARPTLRDTLSDFEQKFPPGTKGFKEQVVPFKQGAPGRAIAMGPRKLDSRATSIPVKDAQQWQMLMKGLGDDVDSVRAVRSTFILDNLKGAKSADTLIENLRTAPKDTLFAVLGEDAAPTLRIIDRIGELETRGQAVMPRGGKVSPTPRLEVLEQALNQVGNTPMTQGFLGKALTVAGVPVYSRIRHIIPFLTAAGKPGSVVRFWKAFDVFTRNGYAPAFIQTVNAIERRTREEESKSNANQNQ